MTTKLHRMTPPPQHLPQRRAPPHQGTAPATELAGGRREGAAPAPSPRVGPPRPRFGPPLPGRHAPSPAASPPPGPPTAAPSQHTAALGGQRKQLRLLGPMKIMPLQIPRRQEPRRASLQLRCASPTSPAAQPTLIAARRRSSYRRAQLPPDHHAQAVRRRFPAAPFTGVARRFSGVRLRGRRG
jgi:hypothetical protein